MAAEFKFGDMICYRGELPHDDPVMYLGPCSHEWSMKGDIDMLTIPEGDIDCKDPAMWQCCSHFDDLLPSSGGTRVFYDHRDVTEFVSVKGAVVTIGVDSSYGQDITVTRRIEL